MKIKLAPRATANRIIKEHDGRLKMSVTAPPVDGKANELLIKYLSGLFGVGKRSVEIIRGETSREKDIAINGIAADKLLEIIYESIK